MLLGRREANSIILNIHISPRVKVSLYLFHRRGKPRPSDLKVRRGGARVKPTSGLLSNLIMNGKEEEEAQRGEADSELLLCARP